LKGRERFEMAVLLAETPSRIGHQRLRRLQPRHYAFLRKFQKKEDREMRKGRVFWLGMLAIVVFMAGGGLSRAAEAPGVTNDTILLGAHAPLTGPLTATGASCHDGWQIYLDMVNDAGGINGRKIKVIWEDDGCVPSKGIAAIRKLTQRDKVFAIVAGVCSNAILPALPILEEEKIPYFTSHCSAPALTKPVKKNIFRAGNIPANLQARAMGMLAVEHFKSKKIGILHLSDEYGVSQRDPLRKYLEENKITPVAVESYNPGDVDYTSQLTRLKNAQADTVIFNAWIPDGAKMVQQAKRMDYHPRWIGTPSTGEEPFAVLAGDAAVGTYHMWNGKYLVGDTQAPVIAKFREEFKKRVGEKPGRPSSGDLVNYSGAMVFVEALKRAGRDLTREKLIQALESIKNFDTPLADPVNFSADQHQGEHCVTFLVCQPDLKRNLLPNVLICPKDQ